MGDRERHPCSDGENYRTSQARVDIEIMDLCSKAVTEVSSVSCTLNFLAVHFKEKYDYVTLGDQLRSLIKTPNNVVMR